MGTRTLNGRLHYSCQRSVHRGSSVDQRTAHANRTTATKSQRPVLHARRTPKGNARDHHVSQSIWGRGRRKRGMWENIPVVFILNHPTTSQPSLMNFCVTDGISVVATRYVSSRNDAAASLVCVTFLLLRLQISRKLSVVFFRDDFQ